MAGAPVVNVYPLSNYTFGGKDSRLEKDLTVPDRLSRMEQNYLKEGLRTSVEGILLVHEHNHPHVLLMQIGNAYFRLPGGRLRPGEDEVEGTKRKLSSKMAPIHGTPEWQIGDLAAVWWRPNFENLFYPYCPPHITKPKEVKKLYVVGLPEKQYFAIPRNLKLLAVPLFDLFDNVSRYGPVISSIPLHLSRVKLNFVT
eukprot:TRINITY_DN4202_c0_g1_i1.p1 TRINITY_DN4202_c0_g1~~TRINITY_DN4202_c0_g1_i1.p1  ORF type:complete len:198 (+),score=34.48 TRINITY_DN4202_c0_g1_i1:556-1149(+)